jgi:NTP pyrophosphatase (non-canonical NTP hydrolase)
MTFDEYQQQALSTALTDPKYKDSLMEQTIWAMGISGEAGEVIEKWKKIVAYNSGNITDQNREDLKKELGDVIWYLSVFADSLGLKLSEVIELNVSKLKDRQKREVIKGAGDNR